MRKAFEQSERVWGFNSTAIFTGDLDSKNARGIGSRSIRASSGGGRHLIILTTGQEVDLFHSLRSQVVDCAKLGAKLMEAFH